MFLYVCKKVSLLVRCNNVCNGACDRACDGASVCVCVYVCMNFNPATMAVSTNIVFIYCLIFLFLSTDRTALRTGKC